MNSAMYGYNELYDTSCTNNGAIFFGNAPGIISPSAAPYESLSVFPSTLLLPEGNYPGINNNELESVSSGALISPTIMKSEDVVNEHDSFNSISNNYYNNNGVYDELISPNNSYNQRSSLSNLLQRSMSMNCSSSSTSGGYSSSLNYQENGFLQHYPNYSSTRTTSIQECNNNNRSIMNLLETGPMRKVFSTGDLQQISITTPRSRRSDSSSSLHENINQISEGMKKVGRYSAEERKERIERYRSKRNQRNFTKKIKYACRKTLADSRPRVRGRFMRNEEPEEPNEICFGSQTDHVHTEYWNNNNNYQQIHGGDLEHGEEDDEVWTNLLESLSVNNNPYFPC
ncbi:hypothetical protein C5167_001169 [Papaver somniferum]|uniref:CCT domain-containing protein n=1 Tax=Papaver somniferum TaxID=3469 RepID=A0A4Y7KUT3_PAPSO|nr:zinc finger protein CONSTANS-LIKE 1-like [Papaver somniferum]RZC76626.1 hypothetical protein C5167_001169 [Papaver somniferum]